MLARGSLHAQRQDMELSGGGKFIQQDAGPTASTEAWADATVPHTWNALDAQRETAGNPGVKGGYQRGACWYARALDIPADRPPPPYVPPISGDFNMDGGLYRPACLIVTGAACPPQRLRPSSLPTTDRLKRAPTQDHWTKPAVWNGRLRVLRWPNAISNGRLTFDAHYFPIRFGK